jgi:hypothetical protein
VFVHRWANSNHLRASPLSAVDEHALMILSTFSARSPLRHPLKSPARRSLLTVGGMAPLRNDARWSSV